MGLYRGFKTIANGYGRSVRAALGLAPTDPVCPWKLAAFEGYTVKPLSLFVEANPDQVAYFKAKGRDEFSAVRMSNGVEHLIVHNDAHHIYRQAANIAHELAHGFLNHEAAPLVGPDGKRSIDPEQEEEAQWLGPAILISEEAALHIVETGMPPSTASAIYRVSLKLLNMRLRVTGAAARIRRRSAA